jgi:ribonuclease J
VARDRIVLAEDGVVVDLVEGRARVVGAVPCGYVYVDGSSVGDVTDASLKDRRILRDEGFISVVVVMDSVTGKVAGGPEIHARGFAEDDSVFDAVRPLIEDALAAVSAEGVSDAHQLQQVVRRVVGRWVSDTYRRRPMILPLVVEV